MDLRCGFVALLCVFAPTMGITTKYMDQWCGSTITNYGSVMLRLTSGIMESKASCYVTVKANTFTDSLLVKIQSIGLDCTSSTLDIFDGSSTTSPVIRKGICGSSFLLLVYHSTQKYITFRYQSTAPPSFSSFKLLITEYHTGFCSFGEFSCSNGRCIPNSLTCDGYDNCGDDSDEIYNCYYHWSIGLQAGVGVGITVFVVLVIFSVSFRIYRRRVYGATYWGNNRAAVVTAQAIPPPRPAGAYPGY